MYPKECKLLFPWTPVSNSMPICSQYAAQDYICLNFFKDIVTSASLVLICLHFLFLLSFLQSNPSSCMFYHFPITGVSQNGFCSFLPGHVLCFSYFLLWLNKSELTVSSFALNWKEAALKNTFNPNCSKSYVLTHTYIFFKVFSFKIFYNIYFAHTIFWNWLMTSGIKQPPLSQFVYAYGLIYYNKSIKAWLLALEFCIAL